MAAGHTVEERDLQKSAAELLQVELIPGTQVMKDVGDVHFAHAHGGIVLIPQPTDDPSDPLNWSKTWKFLAMGTLALATCFSAASAISMAPLFGLFIEQWHLSDSAVSLITGSTVLVLGYGNFLVIPFSNIFGRRAALLASGILFLACTIWQAVAKSYGSFIGGRSLVGLAASFSESMVVQVTADVFFLHERGAWVGFSILSAFFGTFIGPIIAGAMGARYGWRSFFWLSLAIYGVVMILLAAFFPETKYRRSLEKGSISTIQDDSQPDEKPTSGPRVKLFQARNDMVGRGRPSKKQFLPIQKPDDRWKQFLIRDFFAPIRIAIYPIIIWASLCLAGAADLVLMYNLTESFVLSYPPYSLGPAAVGYTNFAFVVGGLIGMSTAGPLSDLIVRRATVRNNGIREAEMRLPALIPYGLITIISVVVAGQAIKHGWSWPILVCVGFGGAGIAITSLPTIGIAYAVDCYKPVSGELMVVATVMKNTSGFSFSYWVPPMGVKYGFERPLMIWFTFAVLPFVLAIPLYFFGKRLRRWTKNASIHSYEELH